MRARTRERRLGAAAVAGLAAALATAPLAHADDGAGASTAPTTAPVTPGSDTPTSSAPASPSPSAATSSAPTDPSSAPTSPASGDPTGTAPTTPAPTPTSSASSTPTNTATAAAPTSPSAPRTPAPPVHAKLTPAFGSGKNRVQVYVQLPPSLTAAGLTAIGSSFELDYTLDGRQGTETCTITDAPDASGQSECDMDEPVGLTGQPVSAQTVHQIASPAWLTADPTVASPPPASFFGNTQAYFAPTPIAPTATPVSATAPAGQTTNIDALPGVDAHGLPESITSVDQGRHGSVTVVPADGPVPAQVAYTPAHGYAGTDSVGYDVTTPLGVTHNTIDVTVIGQPKIAPITVSTRAGKSVTITVDAYTAAGANTVRAAVPNAALPYVVFVADGPGHGSVTSSGHQLVYTPADGFHGSDHLVYGVDAGGARSTAALTITVAAPPPPATKPPATVTSPPATTAAPVPAHVAASRPLASTGDPIGQLLVVGAALLASGAVVTVTSRRRAGTRR